MIGLWVIIKIRMIESIHVHIFLVNFLLNIMSTHLKKFKLINDFFILLKIIKFNYLMFIIQ